MGFHRDSENSADSSILTAPVRRSLRALVLEFVMQSCVNSAMAPQPAIDEFDTTTLANINDVGLQSCPTATRQAHLEQQMYTLEGLRSCCCTLPSSGIFPHYT